MSVRRVATALSAIVVTLGIVYVWPVSADGPRFGPTPKNDPDPRTVTATLARLPLSFEPNAGQLDADVRYAARGSTFDVFLTSREAVLVEDRPLKRPHPYPRGMPTGVTDADRSVV